MRNYYLFIVLLTIGCSKKEENILQDKYWDVPEVIIKNPFTNKNEQIVGLITLIQNNYKESFNVFTKSKTAKIGKEELPEFFRSSNNFIIDNPSELDDSIYIELKKPNGNTKILSYPIKILSDNGINTIWHTATKEYLYSSGLFNTASFYSFTSLDQTGGLSQTIISGLPGDYKFTYSNNILSKIVVDASRWVGQSSYYPYPAGIEELYEHIKTNLGNPIEEGADHMKFDKGDYLVECISKKCTITLKN